MITFKLVKVQVWKNVLKWGHAQSPELSSDPANLSKDDFNVLKGTLQHCIFFIRFYDFTSKEISDAVIPYREILPEELYVDLLQTFLSLHPNSKPIKKSRNSHKSKNVDSKIITFQHANLISKWIDKLDITDNLNTSYEFKLILRGSRDGFAPSKFHEICDNRVRTVTVIKVKNSNEILGGYNPIEWKSNNNFGVTKDSFIFSFENIDNIEKHILSHVVDESKAITNGASYGACFFSDLAMYGKNFYNSCCRKSSYEKHIRNTTNYFSIEEFEVFQIIK
ncbi:hypothetical protein RirG_013410 [Rhizophagus irregularis DAOM 197198w]|uniref:TLDc domain-containing protein n=1 Tax=Rhizophagus irregularis (strain DAOM 197198w) TaxID=1432141 RepID=A0A015LG71_RHIIW|nr:hypothetical protein RirG_013410 [Rhizophagus irregularis DAOM 197198w]